MRIKMLPMLALASVNVVYANIGEVMHKDEPFVTQLLR